MRNIIGVISLIAALAFISCPTDDDKGGGGDKDLPGTIQIQLYGEPVGPNNPASTGNVLLAVYSGTEEVAYQWKFGNANVGENSTAFTPDDPGTYTVTVSAPGYQSKTSKPVTVGGQPTPSLAGTLTITVNGAAVTTAQTGDVLTAVYSGSETVSYQWFKDGENVTPASTTNTAYTPTESGSYTVEIKASGYRAQTSTVTVSGNTLITITFNRNDGGYGHPTKIIAPGAAIGTLPEAPGRNGFTFVGWFTELSGGEEVTEATTFDASVTVYARWSFSGGIPYIDQEEDTLVHENPLMEAGLSFAGTISAEDGAISFTAGAFQYKFPTVTADGAAININDYAYYIVRFELKSATGSGSGVRLRQYNNTTTYVGVTNEWPWFSNEQGSGIRFPVSGAGNTNGFSMLYNGGTTTIEVRITSITFYKLPLYTVQFELNGGEGTDPASVQIYEGSALGAQFPATPTKEDYTFIGWKNAAGAVVTATTPIMGNWTLTAQWVLTAELGDEWIELITTNATSAPVYGFALPNDKTFGDYDRITFKFKIDSNSPNKNGRMRAWGTYPLNSDQASQYTPAPTPWTSVNSRPGMGNDGNFAAGGKLLNEAGEVNYSSMTGWTVQTIEFTARDKNADAAAIKGASGVIAVAFGLIAQSGGTGDRTYYVKDIELSNADGTEKVSALRPTDNQLWNGGGESAYVSQSGSGAVTRTILPYEEDK